MKFTEKQLKLIDLISKKFYSVLCLNLNNKVKYFLLDINLSKVETIRKDNAEKILNFLNLPIALKSKNRILYSFKKDFNKFLNLESINVFSDTLSSRDIHSLLWTKRGEYGIKNVKLVYMIEEIDVVKDIYQEFGEFITVERLLVYSGDKDVVTLHEIPHYNLDYPDIKDSYNFEIGGKIVECSSEMKKSLILAKEKLNYFKGLDFYYIEKRYNFN